MTGLLLKLCVNAPSPQCKLVSKITIFSSQKLFSEAQLCNLFQKVVF